jgi:hypothetical protein
MADPSNPFADMPAPKGTAGTGDNPFADMPPVDWRAQPWAQNTAAGAALGARAGIRSLLGPADLVSSAGPALQRASADQVSAETGGNYSGDEQRALAPTAPSLPSELAIKGLGIEMAPDASPAMQRADQILPWLIPTGNQFARIGEAAGPFNKVMTGARSELGNLADWFISDDMQQYARDHGWGPVAETVAGLVGASARHGVSAVGGKTMPIVAGRPGDESGRNYDVNRDIGVTPPLKSVADPNSSFGRLSSGVSAFPFSSTGEKGALDAQERAIRGTADEALQQFAPGTTPVKDAGPASLNDFSTDLANTGRQQILASEKELKTRSDAIEAQIDPSRKVSAQPVLDAAMNIATDPNAGSQVRKAAEDAYHRILTNVDPATGQIAFNALKTERSTFGALVDNMFQPSSGTRGAKDTVARSISPIEDAMSAQMQQVANDAGQGPAWRQLDQDWKTHGQMKRSLADTAGVLSDANAPQPWEDYATSDDVTGQLRSAVKGGDMPTIENISALGRDVANQAVAETIAAKGRPADSKSGEKFRPDVFGEQADKVNKDVKAYIGQQAPGADVKLQQAIDAAKTTSEPMERGGFKRMLGSVGAGGATVLGAHSLLGTLGTAGLAPFLPLLTSALHDPSFIRAVAGRQFTPDNIAGLLTQYATHAGLGVRPDQLDPVETVRSGLGTAASYAAKAAQAVPGMASSLTRYFGGQR